ncbi:hypothetical protein [Bacillus horti]|uniref:Uncharacterized protein n=1 Tax=Caldalkalibacillus horti TaxID=77523 RepID=A0ABT9VWT4_9BACI|nr:hypothetical protein [Bacillus horti]MDQ0165272.1 hypothetical protein [Bacillus horti]
MIRKDSGYFWLISGLLVLAVVVYTIIDFNQAQAEINEASLLEATSTSEVKPYDSGTFSKISYSFLIQLSPDMTKQDIGQIKIQTIFPEEAIHILGHSASGINQGGLKEVNEEKGMYEYQYSFGGDHLTEADLTRLQELAPLVQLNLSYKKKDVILSYNGDS